MLRRLTKMLGVVVLSTAALYAVPLFVPDTTGVTAQVLVPTGQGGNVAAYLFDIRGNVLGNVIDVPGFVTIGPMGIGDHFGANPPPAIGNLSLLLLNTAFTEGSLATFDPANTSTFAGNQWNFYGNAVPFSSLTDPALQSFIGVIQAQFQLAGAPVDIAEGTLFTYDLQYLAGSSTGAVPEPATMILAGIGIAVFSLARRRN